MKNDQDAYQAPILGPSPHEIKTAPKTSENRTYSISDLAKEYGITLRTLRFYEDKGLLSPKRQGLARIYDGRDRARLATILKGKHLGFTLTEIRHMIAVEEADMRPTAELKLSLDKVTEQISHLERQKADLEAAIKELRATQERLKDQAN